MLSVNEITTLSLKDKAEDEKSRSSAHTEPTTPVPGDRDLTRQAAASAE